MFELRDLSQRDKVLNSRLFQQVVNIKKYYPCQRYGALT